MMPKTSAANPAVDDQRDERERHDQDEGRPPGHGIDEQPAQDGTTGARECRRSRPRANRAAAFDLRKRGAQQRQAIRHQERGTHPLHGTGNDQLRAVGDTARCGGGGAKDREPEREDGSSTIAIAG